MNQNKDPAKQMDSTPSPPEAETPFRNYDCTDCRYVDAYGLVCDDVCEKSLMSKKNRGNVKPPCWLPVLTEAAWCCF